MGLEHPKPRQPRRLTQFDGFMMLNVVALVGSTAYAYAAAEWEFGLYATVTLGFVIALWHTLRRYPYPWWVLGLLQLAVVLHFAGGFVRLPPDSHTLYAHYVLGVRMDKIVHFLNAAIASVAVAHVYRAAGLRLGHLRGFVIVSTVAGLGTAIEIIEYFAVLTLPATGVGDYANLAGDLLMNALGAVAGYAVVRLARLFPERAAEQAVSGGGARGSSPT